MCAHMDSALWCSAMANNPSLKIDPDTTLFFEFFISRWAFSPGIILQYSIILVLSPHVFWCIFGGNGALCGTFKRLRKRKHTGALCAGATKLDENLPEYGRVECSHAYIIAGITIAIRWRCDEIRVPEKARPKLVCGFDSSHMVSIAQNTVTFLVCVCVSRYLKNTKHKYFVEYLGEFRRSHRTEG